ncbi:SGNH/GDSL hydrolase family protein [Pseudobutyrivibrio xylanivorans]|uniref:SGNH/GDSL hydrolase family protein n=1 Tax=Pseudobutyrivibrio xylanivorans TaxID=185007 RepID=A0A5P6VSU0_PSEXY|nr:SGNH/GDSL hydrolase family protein [Pseudobutyrivibrio xylanivorans]QFJ55368.1 SGNH/GDSL hydrolase family protein [Pseudobutyrivibrio xylanivorans]
MKSVLCFGDSNTYGYKPDGTGRFDEATRWTGILSLRLAPEGYRVLEEGLVGRTTVFEDSIRAGRNGSALLPVILETHNPIEKVVIMLGTNDCKAVYNASAKVITRGAEILLKQVKSFDNNLKVLLVSPIFLGEKVYLEEFDPEFNQKSLETSRELKAYFKRLAEEYDCSFLAASDVAEPSEIDQEHLDESGHVALANAIYEKLIKI